MNNVYTIAIRSPCQALRLPTTSLWTTSLRITTGKSALRLDANSRHPSDNSLNNQVIPRQFHTSSRYLSKIRRWPSKPRSAPPKAPKKAPVQHKREEEALVWSHYNAVDGMPLPNGPLSTMDLETIFGTVPSEDEGNVLLQRLQYQRHRGLLSHKNGLDYWVYKEYITEWDNENKEVALDWLRSTFPIDETAAYEVLKRREPQLAHELSTGEFTGVEIQQVGISRPSVLEELARTRQENLIRAQEQEKEAHRRNGASVELNESEDTPRAKNIRDMVRIAKEQAAVNPAQREWAEKWAAKVQITDQEFPPEMSNARRIFPTLFVSLLTVGFSTLLMEYYTPSPVRMAPDIPPSTATMIGLIGLNSFIFMLWKFPPAWPTLTKYFVQIPGYPFALSAIGNIFSHSKLPHLAVNMAVLAFVGTSLENQTSRPLLLSLFLTAGTLGSLGSLVYFTRIRFFQSTSNGASGAIAGILTCLCLIDESSTFKLSWSEWEIPPLAVLSAYLTLDVLALWRIALLGRKVDHVAHLVGAATGAAWAAAIYWARGEGKGEWGVENWGEWKDKRLKEEGERELQEHKVEEVVESK